MTDDAHATLPWAFVVNDPAPEDAPAPDPAEVVTVPGSSLSLRRSDISMANGPPDWHPESHPLAWALARTLRIADGPDEVHKMVVARRELTRFA